MSDCESNTRPAVKQVLEEKETSIRNDSKMASEQESTSSVKEPSLSSNQSPGLANKGSLKIFTLIIEKVIEIRD